MGTVKYTMGLVTGGCGNRTTWNLVRMAGSISPALSGDEGAWRNSTTTNATTINFGDFAGKSLSSPDNDNVFKKQFTLTTAGTYTYIKVVFNYYIIDTWDYDDGCIGWLGCLFQYSKWQSPPSWVDKNCCTGFEQDP